MSDAPRALLFVSTGRTGTGFFAHLIASRYPRQAEAWHITPGSTWLNVLSNAHHARLVPRALLLAAARRQVAGHLRHCDRELFVDSNNHLYALAAIAPELWPALRVVHIVRDPRSYARSHLNLAYERRRSWIANFVLPFWQPNGFLLGEMGPIAWARLGRLERYAWIWEFKNRLLERIEVSGTPYLRARFEDLFGGPDPGGALARLLEFAGLPPATGLESELATPRNVTGGRRVPGWREWPAATCARFAHLAGARMAAYGYGGEPEWEAKLREGRGA